MNRVLMQAGTFVPDDNGRAERLASRLRYLPENGWEPVVSVFPEGNERQIVDVEGTRIPTYRATDNWINGFRNDVSESSRIAKRLVKSFSFPDTYAPFIVRGVMNGYEIIDRENIDVLYTLSYPFTGHLIGYALSRITDVSWLAEFQDPWVTNPILDDSWKKPHEVLERKVVHSADKIVYNYGIQVPDNYFIERYNIREEKVLCLDCPGSTGFDFDRFDDVQPAFENDLFTIVYAGSFYGGSHTPKQFLDALSELIDGSSIPRRNISVHFFGDWNAEYTRMAEELGVLDMLTIHGWVSFETVFSYLIACDVCLLITLPGDKLNIPSKPIDYIASKSPILTITEEGSRTEMFIEEHEIGVSTGLGETTATAEALEHLYFEKETNGLIKYQPSEELLDKINARNLSATFAMGLDEAMTV